LAAFEGYFALAGDPGIGTISALTPVTTAAEAIAGRARTTSPAKTTYMNVLRIN
jgi:hypothetical protein